MFIENCAEWQIAQGKHTEAGENCMLIQITDPECDHPTPVVKYKEVHRFWFLDIEDDKHPWACTDKQAEKIFKLLQHALDNKMNVIVHCVMGVCRSGAVAEAGVVMGFEDTGKWRQPNLLVKSKLFKYFY